MGEGLGVLSSLSADEPVSHALSIVELSSQPVALKFHVISMAPDPHPPFSLLSERRPRTACPH